ncbi:MAG: AsmA family protein [Rhodospirillales bacterium]
MIKVLIGVAGATGLLLAAILIVPGFVDWTVHRDRIADQAERLTGRRLEIGGDIRMTLLPAPALVVTEVRLANVDGGIDPDLIRMRSLAVHVRLAPLLSGRIRLGKVRLVEPLLNLERSADGRGNWSLVRRRPPNEASVPGTPPEPSIVAAASTTVRLDEVEIEHGVVVYREPAAGIDWRIDAVNATLSAASPRGPFTVRGDLRRHGVPIGFGLSAGEVVDGRPLPITVTLSTDAGNARLELGGVVRDAGGSPRFEGRATAAGESVAELVRAVFPGVRSGFLAQPFEGEAELAASASEVAIDALALRLGDTRVSGAATAALGESIAVSAVVDLGPIDLDAWLAMPAVAGPSGAATADRGQRERREAPPWRLPSAITVSAALSADAVVYRGGVVRRLRATAGLADGAITLGGLSALLPGGSEVSVSGTVTAPDGAPRFEGEIDARSADLLGVLDWLGVDVAGVPPGRLRTFTIRGKLAAYPELVQLRDIDARIDGSRTTGGVTWAIARRPALGADLAIDRVNVDAYLPADAGAPVRRPGPAAAPDRPRRSSPAPIRLDSFDAGLRVHIGTLGYRGTAARDIVLDVTLFDGALDVHRAHVADFAGTAIDIAGGIDGLGGTPAMTGLRFDLAVADGDRLLRALDLPSPPFVGALGPSTVSGRAEGPVGRPAIAVAVTTDAGELALDGTLDLSTAPRFDGGLALGGEDVGRLLAVFAAGYRPSGRIGPFAVTGRVRADGSEVAVGAIAATVAGTDVSGTLAADFGGRRPKVSAALATGPVAITPFLPVDRAAGAAGAAHRVPVSWRLPPSPGVAAEAPRPTAASFGPPWSSEPIPVAGLDRLDADLALTAAAIVFPGGVLEAVDLQATLTAGVLAAERLTATLFGGALRAAGRLQTDAEPRIEATFGLDDADLGLAIRAAAGGPAVRGRMTADGRLTSAGSSVAQWVAALRGSGSVRVTGVETDATAAGGALAPLLAVVEGLNRVAANLDGDRAAAAGGTLSATYTIAAGVVRCDDMRFATAFGDGSAHGTADLAAWHLDIAGRLQMTPGVFAGLTGGEPGPDQVAILPFWMRGALDAPEVKIDAGDLSAAIRIPALKRKIRRLGAGKAAEARPAGPTAGTGGP